MIRLPFTAPLLSFILSGLLIVTAFNIHAEAYLNAIGGLGGSQYKTPCPQGQNLMGFELRTGDDVDAIRPVCVISYDPIKFNAPPVTSAWSGGPGGQFTQLLCPAKTPIVIGLFVAAEGVDTIVVNNIHLYCGQAASTQTKEIYPSAIFDAPGYTPSPAWLGIGIGGMTASKHEWQQRCSDGQVAVGVHGRSGVWLDAMGLICDAPRLTAEPQYKSLGRVKTSPTTSTTPQSICDSARSARARNSPAAPALEAQCKASGEIQYKSLGRVPVPPASQAVPIAVPVTKTAQKIKGLTPLVLYWNGERGDNFVTGTAKGAKSAKAAGYKAVRNEACVFKKRQPGTVPLKLYWSKQREDFYTGATAEGSQSAVQAGYKFVRNEGYLYSEPDPENIRIPLKLYWSNEREDNYTTGTNEGAQSTEQAGYGLARTEGYALPASQCQ